ncbi:MAG: SDR family oxidoreductase [Bacteroidota bacterium]
MIKDFEGKVVLITGATSGIGEEFCRQLAERGAVTMVSGRNLEKAEQIAFSIKEAGGQGEALKIDTSVRPDIQKGVDTVFNKHGRLDLIINNAGFMSMGEFYEMDDENIESMLSTNIDGVVFGCYYAYRKMKEQRFGQIVNISSQAGLMPVPGMTAYSTTKHALIGLTSSLREEAKAFGVQVNVVCYGLIQSEILKKGDIRGIDVEETLNWMRFKPVKTDVAVRKTIQALKKDRPIIMIPGYTKFLSSMNRWFPSLMRVLVKRSMKEYRAMRKD